jgi:hypothetical protein
VDDLAVDAGDALADVAGAGMHNADPINYQFDWQLECA